MSGLLLSVLLLYAILVGVNVPAPWLGLEFDGPEPDRRLWFEPPGFVIPVVWFVLFTMLGVARYWVLERTGAAEAWLVVGLAVLCAAYAYYTLGLARLTGISPLWFGLWGNLAVVAAALFVALQVYGVSPGAALLVVPVAVWTSFATAIVVGQMRAQGLV